MQDLILCLDSGTTTVKAAAFTFGGKLMALHELPNTALQRHGVRAEQDMAATSQAAWRVLSACLQQAAGRPAGLIVTGQGDGLWPVDAAGEPLGKALTWLDGRAADLVEELRQRGALDAVAAVTGTRPTTASPSVQLLWLQRHEPERFQKMGQVLRAKEWLFWNLTGVFQSEPSSSLPTWGDWRLQRLSPDIEQHLGLERGLSLLPSLTSLDDSCCPLQPAAAKRLGLSSGLPVLMGPSDVQATAIGLGVGVLDGVDRASIFGTSAIHLGHFSTVEKAHAQANGAMLQPFFAAPACLVLHAGFNGTSSFQQLQSLGCGTGLTAPRALSGLLLQPFFEPGGERAPVSSPHACASLLGWRGRHDASHLAWAAREALAFNARLCHEQLGLSAGALAFGGGLAADDAFAHMLTNVLGRQVMRPANAQSGLVGIGLLASHRLGRLSLADTARDWLGQQGRLDTPTAGSEFDFYQRKFAMYKRLLEHMVTLWPEWSELQATAERLNKLERTNP